MLHFMLLLITFASSIAPTSNAANIEAYPYGNELDDDGNIKWGDLPSRKEVDFIEDRGGVLRGLYAMTNTIIYIVHPQNFNYSRSIRCS